MTVQPSLVLKPAGGSAVMSDRLRPEADELDYFPTPPWAARAGGELIRRIDPQARTCWEPACGGGHMAHGLRDYFEHVDASDIHDHGMVWWTGDQAVPFPVCIRDFLASDPEWRTGDAPIEAVDWVVSNPPFVHGEAFVRAAWPRARRGVAMLLRSVFLEGGKRHALHYGDCPLGVFAQFAERVPMVKGRWDPEASSATAYGWFIFPKPEALPHWSPAPGEMWRGCGIPPGTRKRLTRPSDMAFAAKGEGDVAPVLDLST